MATQDKYTYLEGEINEDDFVSEIKGKPYYNSPKMQEFFEANLSIFDNNAQQGFVSQLLTNKKALQQYKQNAIKIMQNVTSYLDNLSENTNFRKLPQKEQYQKYDEIAKQLTNTQNIEEIKAKIDKIDKQKLISIGITAGLGVAAGVTIASSFAALPVGAVAVGVGGGAIYGGAKILSKKGNQTAKMFSEAPSNAITAVKILAQGKENIQSKEILQGLIKNDTQITSIVNEKVKDVITELKVLNLESKTVEILATKQITVQNELTTKHPNHTKQIEECVECHKQLGAMQCNIEHPLVARERAGITPETGKNIYTDLQVKADESLQNLVETLGQGSKPKINELCRASKELGKQVMEEEIKTPKTPSKDSIAIAH